MKLDKPFSLSGRIILLVTGINAITLVLHSIALAVFLRPLGDELVSRIVERVHFAEAALRTVPAARRDEFAEAVLEKSMSIRRSPPSGFELNGENQGFLVTQLLRELGGAHDRKSMPLIMRDDSGEGLASVPFELDGETWWITTKIGKPLSGWTLPPALASVILTVLAAGVAMVLGVRLITRPMSQLAKDMLARRSQVRGIDATKPMSSELQGLVQSFNAMVHAVELANLSRRDLLAGVSHDLRTPLSRLRLRVETECDEQVAKRMDPDFAAISRIIDQFLAYSQGQDDAAIGEYCELAEIVQTTASEYDGDDLRVTVTHSGDVRLRVQDVAIKRVLSNLIDNARTHGKAPIEVELQAGENEVSLVVFDAGSGFSEEDRERAFQPFVRLSPSTPHDGHCGLGLAIVAQLADQLKAKTVIRPFDGHRFGIGLAFPIRTL